MCGRYALYTSKEFFDHFHLPELALNLKSNYNVAPSSEMPVVIATPKGNAVDLMRWGLIPFWAKDPKIGFRTINARSEDLLDRASYKHLLNHKRCLIPANGFYEWSKKTTSKEPYYFHLKNQPIFSFAGLYDSWLDSASRQIYSYTIITTSANPLIAPVHDRMPVILSTEDEALWLDPSKEFKNGPSQLLRSYPDNLMVLYPVSKNINSVAINDPSLIEPLL